MTVRVRFAPSPTGHMHIGNLRTALITWLFARHNAGHFLLRIDDTDRERSKLEYEEGIESALIWMGLAWDEKARQMDRLGRYAEIIETLKASGRLYPCYETPDELSLRRKALLTQGLPPVYDRAALRLTTAQKESYEKDGRVPHWRFRLEDGPIDWDDLVRGPVHFDGAALSDPVLIREDGSPLYHLCSVIDDIDYDMTHIVRGEDHVTNTATHIQMFQAIGAKPPQFAHLPLVSGAEGGKLSKRLGAVGILALRDDEGLEPMAIASLLARLGTSDPIEPCLSLAPLIESFDFGKFSRGSPKLDPDEMLRLNAKILHQTPFESVNVRLANMGMPDLDEGFWEAVRPNVERLSDVREWWRVARGPVTPVINDPDFARTAAALLPPAPWTNETWTAWVAAVKSATGRKGKDLFMPLRQALTGMDHGPELGPILPLIGPQEAARRLQGG